MKKSFTALFIILVCFIIVVVCLKYAHINNNDDSNSTNSSAVEDVFSPSKDVSYNGWLHTSGTKIKNSKDEIVVLKRY